MTRVEVTMDGGDTWDICELDHQERGSKYGKFWCWCFWSLEVEVLDLLGAKEIGVRAWDESLNTQPEKLIWNVMVNTLLLLHINFYLFFQLRVDLVIEQNNTISLITRVSWFIFSHGMAIICW